MGGTEHLQCCQQRPPLAIRTYAYGTPSDPLSFARAEGFLDTVARVISSQVGLSVVSSTVHVVSGRFSALTPGILSQQGLVDRVLGVNFATYPGIAGHVEVVGGSAPRDEGAAATPPGQPVPVWLRADLANELRVQPGDRFPCEPQFLLDDPEDLEGVNQDPVVVEVAGLWVPQRWGAPQAAGAPSTGDFWFGPPDEVLTRALLVSRADYVAHIEPRQIVKIQRADWDLVLDLEQTAPAHVQRYLTGFRRALTTLQAMIPTTLYDDPPLGPLSEYASRGRVLTTMLLSFDIPGVAFVLFFLGLSSSMIAHEQQHDTTALLSRGTPARKLLGLVAIEELLVFVPGCPLGILLGLLLALGMGNTVGFLAFTPRPSLPVSIADLNVGILAIALAAPLAIRVGAALAVVRRPVATTDRERARPVRAPFWMRYGLDLLLLAPTLYFYRRLAAAGSLAALAPEHGRDLYQNPELVLLPTLFIVTGSLVSLRAFPLLMLGVGRAARLLPGTSAYLALRNLGRRWQHNVMPLLLTTVALALGIYAYSMALSLDRWLVDQTYYSVGADLTFSPVLERPVSQGAGPAAADASSADVGYAGGAWIPPVGDFLDLPGVAGATRVGRYRAQARIAGNDLWGEFLAVDRTTLSDVAWFREDFAGESLGALLNHLAESPKAILVPTAFLQQFYLAVGDDLPVHIALADGVAVDDVFRIVGTYDLFPTITPGERAVFIGNLDFLSGMVGITVGHDIWLRVAAGTPGSEVFAAVPQLGIGAESRRDSRAMITRARDRYERVAVFGTLTQGFLTAVAMAAITLLIYCRASMQERIWWLSVLRAVGTTRRQLVRTLVVEQAVVLAFGTTLAVALGTLTSRLFVPYMRIAPQAAGALRAEMAETVPLPP